MEQEVELKKLKTMSTLITIVFIVVLCVLTSIFFSLPHPQAGLVFFPGVALAIVSWVICLVRIQSRIDVMRGSYNDEG